MHVLVLKNYNTDATTTALGKVLMLMLILILILIRILMLIILLMMTIGIMMVGGWSWCIVVMVVGVVGGDHARRNEAIQMKRGTNWPNGSTAKNTRLRCRLVDSGRLKVNAKRVA